VRARRELEELIERTKDAGAQAALFDPASEEWAEGALDAIRYFARAGRTFTADDVRNRVGDPPAPGAVGAVFRQASKARLIRPAGWTVTDRVVGHGRDLRQWEGCIP